MGLQPARGKPNHFLIHTPIVEHPLSSSTASRYGRGVGQPGVTLMRHQSNKLHPAISCAYPYPHTQPCSIRTDTNHPFAKAPQSRGPGRRIFSGIHLFCPFSSHERRPHFRTRQIFARRDELNLAIHTKRTAKTTCAKSTHR